MVHFKLVIFDLYHTLLHKSGKLFPYGGILKASPNPAATYTYLLTHEIYEVDNLFKKLREKGLINRPVNQVIFSENLEEDIRNVTFYPGAFETIVSLRTQGYKLGVIANLTTPYQRPFFDRAFEYLIPLQVFSSSLGIAKPDKEIYEQISWRSGFSPEEILIVGDNIRLDYAIPRQLGMEAILLNRFPSVSPYGKEVKQIKSMQELPALIN